MMRVVGVACIALLVSCTKENAAFCCLSEEDCAAKGVTDGLRECAAGLACVGNTCEAPTCSSGVCGPSAPVCDTVTDQCVGCVDSAACSIFPDTPVCETNSGSCVACLVDGECGAMTPVCDHHACRACQVDSECASGACAEDGSCADPESIVYLAPTGVDVAPCSKSAPCKDLAFAVTQTSSSREHVLLAKGDYAASVVVSLDSQTTTAASVSIHGGGARILVGNPESRYIDATIPVFIRDLELEVEGAFAATIRGGVIERVRLRGLSGLYAAGNTTMRDVSIQVSNIAIQLGAGTVTLDRIAIRGGRVGVVNTGAFATIQNLIVTGTSELGVDWREGGGEIRFSSVGDTGALASGPTGIDCVSSVRITASVVWNEAVNAPAVGPNCLVEDSIVGPVPFPGATNSDPLFVSSTDLHLMPASPARDQLAEGPPLDIDGEPRPFGAGFDLGADEAR